MACVIDISVLNPSRLKAWERGGRLHPTYVKDINIRMKALTFEKLILNL